MKASRPALFRLHLAMVVLLLLGGCAGYQPESSGAPVRLALAPLLNESDVPQLVAPLARNLRESIAHSPAWQLAGEESAEARLSLTVIERQREAVARDPEDTGRPLSYFETLQLRLEWESNLPPPWGPDPVATLDVETLLYAQPSLVVSERDAVNEWAVRAAREVMGLLNRPPSP